MMESQFDTLIHAPNRLQICALLASAASMEFAILKDQLDVSDSVLSKHLKSLEDAGYVTLDKKALHGRQRTWLSLTAEGHNAFTGHVTALKAIVG
jgi:DNA-binding MarR family transcriptional regulator